MKHLLSLSLLVVLLSCGNVSLKNHYEIIYVFTDAKNISEQEKKETIEVIKKRLNRFNKHVETSLTPEDEILLKLRTNFDTERLNKIVLNPGKLDFWLCYTQKDINPFYIQADKVLSNDSITNPITSMLMGYANDGSFTIAVKDTTKFKEFINKEEVKSLFREDFKNLKFLFGMPTNDFVSLYGVRSNGKDNALVNETHIVEVKQDYDQVNRPAISINMNEYGAYSWTKLTNDAYKNNANIAIALNNVVYSAPSVASGPITGGRSQISGDFSLEEALNFSYILSTQKSIPKLRFIKVTEIENQ